MKRWISNNLGVILFALLAVYILLMLSYGIPRP